MSELKAVIFDVDGTLRVLWNPHNLVVVGNAVDVALLRQLHAAATSL